MSVTDVNGLDLDTRPRMETVAPGVFAFVQPDGSWGLNNAGLVVSEETSVLIDTCFTERRNRILRWMVTSAAARPPDVLVNTHHHGDHVYGNGWFPEALVVSHEATRDAVARLDPAISARRFATVDFGETRSTTATLTFDSRLQLHVGDMTLDVSFPGLAHCVGNSVVFVRERSVLFAGDLLLKDCTPSFAGGSAVGYLPVLDELRRFGAETIVPGHGPVCDASVIDDAERYVRFVLDVAADAVACGRTPAEAARTQPLGEFDHWLDTERLIGNLYRAMHELSPDRPEYAMDVDAMCRDTEAYHGGALHSRA